MCLLLETIRYENGTFQNLAFHQERMDVARKALFNDPKRLNLEAALAKEIASRKTEISTSEPVPEKGLFKCRVVYDTKVRSIEWTSYKLPIIKRLKIMYDSEIEYAYKYENRTALNELFQQSGTADDILIVKNGYITDTSFCNILFFNGKNWITPDFPLLKGTQRQLLLEQERIIPARITPDDLGNFSKARLINAMIRFEDALDIEMKDIS